MSEERVRRAAATIVDLGIAANSVLAPYAGRSEDARGFLKLLHQAEILTEGQLSVLLGMFPPTTEGLERDPYLGLSFGEYTTRRKIGQGGMGRVYLAMRPGDERPAVVKVFLASDDAISRQRFKREGELMASLRHPNIIEVYGSGEAHGAPYILLEYVPGITLHELVARRQRLPWESATKVVLKLAAAVAAVHVLGIVHRDIKPHNVLVGRDGAVKLLDFGLAKAPGDMALSTAGQVLGSPAYMAPEQWGDHDVDHRIDLFSLGVTYYFLLTGTTPFQGRTPVEFATSVQTGRYTPIEGYSPTVPPAVRSLVAQLLERDRRYRTPTAPVLIHELHRVLRHEPPNVPRLEGSGAKPMLALVGKDLLRIGAEPGADLHLDSSSVLPEHATIERVSAGALLRALGGRTAVNHQRVQEVILKDGDRVEFGTTAPLTFHRGNLGGSGLGDLASSSESFSVDGGGEAPLVAATAPVLIAALTDAGHPSTLLASFEALDLPHARRVLDASEQVLARLGLEEGARRGVRARAETLWAQRKGWLADRLFHATHENLGEDVQAWLAWWFEVHYRFPTQLRPAVPLGAARLVRPVEGTQEVFALEGGDSWTIGRASTVEVQLSDMSVSRRHAAVVRLSERYAFRDLGSRLGIKLDGARREVGLLCHGDTLECGRVSLRFDYAAPPRRPEPWVDRATFSALVEAREPHTLEALVELLDGERLRSACRAASHGIELEGDLEDLVEPFVCAQRAVALEALPVISGQALGSDHRVWRSWLERARGQLPAQVTVDWVR